MSGALHVRHYHNLHEMTDMQAVGRRIEPYIERDLLVIEDFLHFLFIAVHCAMIPRSTSVS